MRTHKNLFDEICSFRNILSASRKARRGKRTRPNVMKFEHNIENEIVELSECLRSRTYKPGNYKEFHICEPKKRMISAAPYRDRVVHHALCNVIEPIFERSFIYDTYANRKNKGTLRAVYRYQWYASQHRYVLKCDISKYFPSIDHELLKMAIRKKIACQKTLWLVDAIIDNSNPQVQTSEYFPGDDLFMPFVRRKGLPIGNLTSQFFANVYLNDFDHYVKEILQEKAYVRYVDDFVVFGNDKSHLHLLKDFFREALAKTRLTLHEDKSLIHLVQKGVPFLGYKVYPGFLLLKNESIVRFRRRMKKKQEQYRRAMIDLEHIRSSIHGWLGYAVHANTYHVRNVLLGEMNFIKG